MTPDREADLELLLRRVIREEAGITPVAPADKWRGGTLVLRPGSPGVQEKSWPIETFFHKIVMLRNRLRTLEQHVNASDLPDDVKVKLQGYVSGCYVSPEELHTLATFCIGTQSPAKKPKCCKMLHDSRSNPCNMLHFSPRHPALPTRKTLHPTCSIC